MPSPLPPLPREGRQAVARRGEDGGREHERAGAQVAGRAGRAAAVPSRLAAADRARGLALVLVVLGHALGGLLDAGLLARRGPAGALWDVIYVAHMPLFFFLAGLFVPQRLSRDARGFVREALVRLGWPLLLWATLQWLVIVALGPHVNRPVAFDPLRLATLVWSAPSQFWFLQALLLMQLAAWATLRRAGALAWLAGALAARVLLETGWVTLPEPLVQPCRFAPFFALGLALGPARLAAVLERAGGTMLALALLVWACVALLVFRADTSPWGAPALPGALAGAFALLLAAERLRGRAGAALETLGRHAMAVFLLHVLFVAGTRIALVNGLGVAQPALLLAAATVLGIAGPLAARALALRLRVARPLGLA